MLLQRCSAPPVSSPGGAAEERVSRRKKEKEKKYFIHGGFGCLAIALTLIFSAVDPRLWMLEFRFS